MAQAGAHYLARYKVVLHKYSLFIVPGQECVLLFTPRGRRETLLKGQSAGGCGQAVGGKVQLQPHSWGRPCLASHPQATGLSRCTARATLNQFADI